MPVFTMKPLLMHFIACEARWSSTHFWGDIPMVDFPKESGRVFPVSRLPSTFTWCRWKNAKYGSPTYTACFESRDPPKKIHWNGWLLFRSPNGLGSLIWRHIVCKMSFLFWKGTLLPTYMDPSLDTAKPGEKSAKTRTSILPNRFLISFREKWLVVTGFPY